VRSLCILRETLARHDGLADLPLPCRGWAPAAISLFGTPDQKSEWLTLTRAGKALSAFALSEPASGSDVANMAMTAMRDGDDYVLNGEKTWISNGGIADVYCGFARTGEAPGAKGLSAFIVPADTPGLEIAERLEVVAPHPLARLAFDECRIPASAMIGNRATASALPCRCSTCSARPWPRPLRLCPPGARRKPQPGQRARTVRRADERVCRWCRAISPIWRSTWMPRRCWSTARPGSRIQGAPRVSREAAMAKLYATDHAQEVIDKAVQLHGGDGVRKGHIVESLYREIRALRIYEGASDVQKVVIARQTLANSKGG
jgi:acyl-CoA dehydrogenase